MVRTSLLSLPSLLAVLALTGCPDAGTDTANKDPQACTGPVAAVDAASVTGTVGASVEVSGTGTVCSGDATLTWNVEQVPVGSAIDNSALDTSDPQKAKFTPDTVGGYVLSLTSTDAAGTASNPAYVVVTVSSGNSPPTAECGGSKTGKANERIDFDGSGSSDPEGAALTYDWSVASSPEGSGLGPDDIFNGNTVTASVVPDVGGIYVIGLVVSDGENWSEPSYCTLNVDSGDDPPVADAGDSTTLSPCTDEKYQLDGYGSYDPEGNDLSYQWALISAPAGSSAGPDSFSDATIANPVFVWDKAGAYTIELRVYDGAQWSTPDIVTYTFQDQGENHAPVANAGEDQTISTTPECDTTSYTWSCDDCKSEDVELDGSGSDDPLDGDALSFYWSEVDTSDLTIQSPYSAVTKVYTPSFASEMNVAITKSWIVDLQVSDCVDGDHDEVTITYTCTGEYSP